jgi:hypothetical protein
VTTLLGRGRDADMLIVLARQLIQMICESPHAAAVAGSDSSNSMSGNKGLMLAAAFKTPLTFPMITAVLEILKQNAIW